MAERLPINPPLPANTGGGLGALTIDLPRAAMARDAMFNSENGLPEQQFNYAPYATLNGIRLSDYGKKSEVRMDPDGRFWVQKRVDAPGSPGWNDDRKYHYESTWFAPGANGSFSQSEPWVQKALESSWKNSGPDVLKFLGTAAAMYGGAQLLGGTPGASAAGAAPGTEGAVASAVPQSVSSGTPLITSSDKAFLYNNLGYGAPMTGAETAAFDAALPGLGVSSGIGSLGSRAMDWIAKNPLQAMQLGSLAIGAFNKKDAPKTDGGLAGLVGNQSGMTANSPSAPSRSYSPAPQGYRPGIDPEHQYFKG